MKATQTRKVTRTPKGATKTRAKRNVKKVRRKRR